MITTSEEETKKLAADLLEKLEGPTVIALYGELGSGKTHFVQGLAQSLGIERRVISPTFVLLRSYETNNARFKTLHHLDLYRAETKESALTSGIEEILADKDTIVAIEWPEVIEELLPKNTVRVRIKSLGENQREIVFD